MPRKKPSKKTGVTKAQIFWAILILAAIFGILCAAKSIKSPAPEADTSAVASPAPSFDFGNRVFTIDNNSLTFISGSYTSADGSVTANISNKTLSLSGKLAGAILTANFGGSGTFSYLVGATNQNGQEIYSQPVLLGDRIKISSLKIEDPEAHDNGEVVVEYLDRPATAPMSEIPTIKSTGKYAFEDNGNLISVLH